MNNFKHILLSLKPFLSPKVAKGFNACTVTKARHFLIQRLL